MNKILSNVLWIVIILAIGTFAINQVLDYRYKVELLKTPCQLCAELNKNQSMCINNCFKDTVKVFPDGLGGWCGEDGFKYDLNGNKKNETCQGKENINRDFNLSNFLQSP